MTLEQFKAKWGTGDYAIITLRELINRVDQKGNTSLIAMGREICEDLQQLTGDRPVAGYTSQSYQRPTKVEAVPKVEGIDYEDLGKQPRK